MNDLVKFGGNLPANPDELSQGLQNMNANLQPAMGGTPLLKLLKDGWYAYGAENVEMQEGSQWALNPASLEHGWACWSDGELLGEQMVPFNQAPPAMRELPDYGAEWRQQSSVLLQCLTGEDTGVQVLYKGTSVGMRQAIKGLIDELVGQLKHDPQNCVPVIEFDVDSYQHKKHGKIYTPILNIVGWMGFDGAAAETASEPDDKPQDEPEKAAAAEPEAPARGRRRRRKAADDAPAAETAHEAPADDPPQRGRRRRRRSAA